MTQDVRPDRDPAGAAARIEALVREAEGLPDERPRSLVVELLREILALYGNGWQRMMELIGQHHAPLRQAVIEDNLLGHLLMLHGLYPIPLEERVAHALEEVRPALLAHGGNVELLALEQDRLRLRLIGSCQGCPSSTLTLKTTVEEALRRAAPELARIEVEGTDAAPIMMEMRR